MGRLGELPRNVGKTSFRFWRRRATRGLPRTRREDDMAGEGRVMSVGLPHTCREEIIGMGILAAKAGFPYECREGNIASFFSSPGIRSPTRVWGRAFAILLMKSCNMVSHMRVGKTTRSLRFRRPREGAYLCKKQPNIMKKTVEKPRSPPRV